MKKIFNRRFNPFHWGFLLIFLFVGVGQSAKTQVNMNFAAPVNLSLSNGSIIFLKIDNPTSAPGINNFFYTLNIPLGTTVNIISASTTFSIVGNKLNLSIPLFPSGGVITCQFKLTFNCNFFSLHNISGVNAGSLFATPFTATMQKSSIPLSFVSNMMSGISPLHTWTRPLAFPFLEDVSNALGNPANADAHKLVVLPGVSSPNYYVKYHAYKNIGTEAFNGWINYEDLYSYITFPPSALPVSVDAVNSRILKGKVGFLPSSRNTFGLNDAMILTPLSGFTKAFNTTTSVYSNTTTLPPTSPQVSLDKNEFLIFEERFGTLNSACFQADVNCIPKLCWSANSTWDTWCYASKPYTPLFPDIINNMKVTGNTRICAGESTTLSLSGGNYYEYTILTGPSANTTVIIPFGTQSITLTPSATTNYEIRAIRGLLCTAKTRVRITVSTNPNVTISTLPSSTQFCYEAGNLPAINLTANASGGNPTYTYKWTATPGGNLGTSKTLNASPSVNTNYTVVVSDINGCSATATQAILSERIPSVTINSLPYCLGSGDVLAAVPLQTVQNNIIYEWTDPMNGITISSTFEPTVDGTYILTAKTANCSASLLFDVKPEIVATLSTPNELSICPGATTTISYALSGGSGVYFCELADVNGIVVQAYNGTSPASFNVSPTSAQIYCLKTIQEVSTSANTCNGQQPECVIVHVSPPLMATIGNYTICPTQVPFDMNIHFTGAPPFTFDIIELSTGLPANYSLGIASGLSTTAFQTTITGINVTTGGPTDFIVANVKDANCGPILAGGTYNFDPFCISVGGSPCLAIEMSGSTAICSGSTPNLDFTIKEPNGLPVPPGSYNVIYTFTSSSGLITPYFSSLTVLPGVSPTVTITIPAPTGPVSNSGCFTPMSVTVAGPCPPTFVPFFGAACITVNAPAVGLLISKDKKKCIPSTADFDVLCASTQMGLSYKYEIAELPSTNVLLTQIGVASKSSFALPVSNNGMNTYQLQNLAEMSTNCVASVLNSVNVLGEEPISISLVTPNQTVCYGALVNISGTVSNLKLAPNTQNVTIVLSNGITIPIVSTGNGTGSFSANFVPLTSQTITVTHIAESTKCTPLISPVGVSIQVVSPPASASFTAGPNALCAGNSTVLTSTAAASNYTWFQNNTQICTSCPNTITVTPSSNPTTYTLKTSNAGCLTTTEYSLSIPVKSLPLPPCPITQLTALSGNYRFTVPNDPDVYFSWSITQAADFDILTGNGTNEIVLVRKPGSTGSMVTITVMAINSCGISIPCVDSFIIGGCFTIVPPGTKVIPNNTTFFTQGAWDTFRGTFTNFIVMGKLTFDFTTPILPGFIFNRTPGTLEFSMQPGASIDFINATSATPPQYVIMTNSNFTGDCEMWYGLIYDHSNILLHMNNCIVKDALYGLLVNKAVAINMKINQCVFEQCRHGINFSSAIDFSALHKIEISQCQFGNAAGPRIVLKPSTTTPPMIAGTGPFYQLNGISALAVDAAGTGFFGKGNGILSSVISTTSNEYLINKCLFRNLEYGIREDDLDLNNTYSLHADSCQFKDLYSKTVGASYDYQDGTGIRLRDALIVSIQNSQFLNIPNYAIQCTNRSTNISACNFNNINYNFDNTLSNPPVPTDYATVSLHGRDFGASTGIFAFTSASDNVFDDSSGAEGYRAFYSVAVDWAHVPFKNFNSGISLTVNQVKKYQRGFYVRGVNGGGYIDDNYIGLSRTNWINGSNGNDGKYGINAYSCSGNIGSLTNAGLSIRRNVIKHFLGGTSPTMITSLPFMFGIVAGDHAYGTSLSSTTNLIHLSENKIYGIPYGISLQGLMNAGSLSCNLLENCSFGILLSGPLEPPFAPTFFAIPNNTIHTMGNRWVYSGSSLPMGKKVEIVGFTLPIPNPSTWLYHPSPNGTTSAEYNPVSNYAGIAAGNSCSSTCTLVNFVANSTATVPCSSPKPAPEVNEEFIEGEEENILVYPTAISPSETIYIQKLQANDRIELFNSQAQKVAEQKVQEDSTTYKFTQTESLSAGLYYMIIRNTTGKKMIHKIVVR